MRADNFKILKSSRIIFILVLFSLPFVSLASSNAICDTLFWFIKISYFDFWLKLVKRGPADPAIYDAVQSTIAVVISLILVRKLAFTLELDRSAIFKTGIFHWSFPFFVLIAPIIMALPHYVARIIFNLSLPIESLDEKSAYLMVFVLAVLIPLQEEAIWRGLGVTFFKKIELSERQIMMIISFGFLLGHLPSDIGILRPLALAPMAFILCWLRLRSGGLFWPILFHGFGNGVVVGTPLPKIINVYLFGL